MTGKHYTLAFVAAAALASALAEDRVAPHFDVVAVKGKLIREQPVPEERLQEGATALPGALLRTGWRSRAELAAPASGARFLIRSRTRVRLAEDPPGVLLEVEKGTLRAIFDAITGDDEPARVVTTPSAVLAVRGTEYGVEVDSKGNTTVVVFEGEVEVVDTDRLGDPVRVAAGHYARVQRGKATEQPRPHKITPQDFDRGRTTSIHPNAPGTRMQPGATDPGGAMRQPSSPSRPSQGSGRRGG